MKGTKYEKSIALDDTRLEKPWVMGRLVSGYLDFAEHQTERERIMTMSDGAEHLDRILTMG